MAFRLRPLLTTATRVRPSPKLASRRIQPLVLRSLRCRSTTSSRAQSSRGSTETRTITIPTLPKLLIGLALTCLTVGLYEYLASDIQKYPPDIRQALRKALYYQHNGKDLNSSVKYFREALQMALESPEMERDGAPLTGIVIQLGALLESMGRLPEARQTLTLALRHLAGFENDRDSNDKKPDSAFFDLDVSQFPPLVQKKLVGIAQKLGDINAAMKRDEEAEKWYTWSVEHLLKVSSRPVSPYGDSEEVIFDREHMPKWLTETEMGAALEALGGFYAERNKPSYAIHLYLRALTLSGVRNCHSTVIMNNLSESFAAMGKLEEAKQWAERGLELAENPNTAKVNKDAPVCNESCGVLLYNMGMLHEQMDDKSGAIAYYEKARNHGRQYKLLECIQQSNLALRRLQQQQQ